MRLIISIIDVFGGQFMDSFFARFDVRLSIKSCRFKYNPNSL